MKYFKSAAVISLALLANRALAQLNVPTMTPAMGLQSQVQYQIPQQPIVLATPPLAMPPQAWPTVATAMPAQQQTEPWAQQPTLAQPPIQVPPQLVPSPYQAPAPTPSAAQPPQQLVPPAAPQPHPAQQPLHYQAPALLPANAAASAQPMPAPQAAPVMQYDANFQPAVYQQPTGQQPMMPAAANPGHQTPGYQTPPAQQYPVQQVAYQQPVPPVPPMPGYAPAPTVASPAPGDAALTQVQQQLYQLQQELAVIRAQQQPLPPLPRTDSAVEQTAVMSPVSDDEYESDGIFGALADRWATIEDPEVAIINWQTGVKDEKKSGDKKEDDKKPKKKEPKKWYEKLAMRGYTQMRIAKVTDLEPGSYPPQVVGDRSVGDNQEFLLRRVRLIIFGDVSDHMGVYLQPDFAVTPPGSTDNTHFAQIRDWYADCYIDKCKVNRVRVGQSKVPYGWENMQSSSNRLSLDRTDPLNSAVRNERDLGVFYYWTPEPAQEFFKEVIDEGLKGSGNYGVFGLGCYNGQGGSLLEQNDTLHMVARLTLPMTTDNGQHIEASIQGYTGNYVVLSSPIRPLGGAAQTAPAGTLGAGNDTGILDQRVAASFIYYPQPWGFQAEWNVGRGPALNAAQTAVVEDDLQGGYAQLMYQYKTDCHGILFPFARYAYYKGGYKTERNAPFAHIDEFELGCEWQMNPQMELTALYTWTDRTNTTAINQAGITPYGQFDGQFLRFQFQFNY